MAFCPRCNAELSDHAAFCLACGTYFGAPAAEAAPPSLPPQPQEGALRESTRLTPTRSGETPTAQSPAPPPQIVPPASAFQKVLTRVVDRFRCLLAKITPLIKANPWIARGTVMGVVVVIALGAWRLHHSRTSVPTNPQAAEIVKLENLARGAYMRNQYVVPVETSAIAYSKRVLALEPSNDYCRTLLENSVGGGKYQVQQALNRKNFTKAHRLANAMDQLLPGRKDIAELKQDIRIAERGSKARVAERAAAAAPPRQKAVPHQNVAARENVVARQKPAPKVSFTAYHMHGEKAPADHGPYCVGVLSVTGQHLKFKGRSASSGQKVHELDFPCSNVREIKKNSRVASRQGGFHVRTVSANTNFAAQDSSLTHVSSLASACSDQPAGQAPPQRAKLEKSRKPSSR